MPVRFRPAVAALLAAGPLLAQSPVVPPRGPLLPAPPTPPPTARPTPFVPPPQSAPLAEPRPLPQFVGVPAAQPATDVAPPPGNPDVPLPRAENLQRIDSGGVAARRFRDGWQVWAGAAVFRDLGPDQAAAEELAKAVRDLRPTEWATVGTPRPVVEYGLMNGKPTVGQPHPKWAVPVDLLTVRADNVRGAWVVRDAETILLNFGPHKGDAEQAAAVCKRYGYNRLGMVGHPLPATAYFFATAEVAAKPKGFDTTTALLAAAQEQQLARTGVPVPGVGFVGERLVIDPRKTEARKDGGQWVLAHGPDVLARFGMDEWGARDAAKVVRDGNFTEFCTVSGATFFLANGAAPTRVPFSAQGTRFSGAQPRAVAGGWAVTDGAGRVLFPTATEDDADRLAKAIKAYQFDQVCRVGASPRAGLAFLAKTGR